MMKYSAGNMSHQQLLTMLKESSEEYLKNIEKI